MQQRNFVTMKNALLVSIGLLGASLLTSTQAFAAGAVEIGGRTAVTANFSVTTQKPDKLQGVELQTSIINLGTNVTRTTDSGRWEFGAGFVVTAVVVDVKVNGDNQDATFTLFTPSAQVRINSDLMGPEENILLYLGFIAGVTIIDSDEFDDFNDEVGAFGPKFGVEYYFTSNIAVQLEDQFLGDTEKGITNNLSLGIKVLF